MGGAAAAKEGANYCDSSKMLRCMFHIFKVTGCFSVPATGIAALVENCFF